MKMIGILLLSLYVQPRVYAGISPVESMVFSEKTKLSGAALLAVAEELKKNKFTPKKFLLTYQCEASGEKLDCNALAARTEIEDKIESKNKTSEKK